jgi:hypothetical protein
MSEELRDEIEKMSKFNQIEILRILVNRKIVLNENKYGTHVNLAELDEETIQELQSYAKYVRTQEMDLNQFEQEKEKYKNIFFDKDNKDNHLTIDR